MPMQLITLLQAPRTRGTRVAQSSSLARSRCELRPKSHFAERLAAEVSCPKCATRSNPPDHRVHSIQIFWGC